MKVMRWVAGAALMTGIVVPAAGPAAAAAPPTRVTATSPTTGVTYTATWSCAGGQVRIAGVHNSETDVYMRFKVEPSTGSWLSRPITKPGSFQFSTGGDARNDNGKDSVVVEDGFAIGGPYSPVLTLTIPDCPDYTQGTRSVFQGVAPQRVLDTRPETAVNSSGQKLGAGGTVTVGGSAWPGIPADATAVSITLTGTDASGPGFLQAIPTGGGVEAGSSSNVNLSFAGATVANLAVVPLGTDKSITIFSSSGAHVLVDVNGYFVPATGPVAAGRLEALTAQKRMLDTRPGTAVNWPSGVQPSGTTLSLDLTSGASGLPVGANAAVVNITATETSGPGFVQAAAGGTLVPGASSVLNVTGSQQTVAGLSIVPLSSTGSIDLFTSGGAHLIVDLVGWFTGSNAETSTAGRFVPLPPERVYDSRLESMVNADTFWNAAGIRSQTVWLPALEQQVGAIFVNGTATGNVAPGFVTLGAFNPGAPTSNMNLPTVNATVANAAVIRGSLGFPIRALADTHVILDIAGYFTLASA